MAQPSTELVTFRQRTTTLLDRLNGLNDVLNIIEGAGTTDAERLAFFQTYIDANPGYDITVAQLTSAVQQLRILRNWVDDNLPVLSRMRI
jgi:hypothetical protein